MKSNNQRKLLLFTAMLPLLWGCGQSASPDGNAGGGGSLPVIQIETADTEGGQLPVISMDSQDAYAPTETAVSANEVLPEGTRRIIPAAPETVTLAFAGDINFDDRYTNMITMRSRANGIFDSISEDLLAEMTGADIMMINNEFPYSKGGSPTPEKQYTFRADPAYAVMLQQMGVDIVTLANNHAYDYGPQALEDTFATLEGVGIPYVGAGRNIGEAMKPAYFLADSMKIGFVAATQIERNSVPDTKEATETSPGVLRTLNPEKAVAAISEAKANSDFVVMFVHWGSENTYDVEASQRDLARQYAAAGADLIIGAHSHCLQGIEYVDGVPVIYSLGNFWFNSKALDTGIFKVTVTPEGIAACQFVPARQENCRTFLLHDAEKARVIEFMRSISFHVDIDENGIVTPKKG